MYRDRPIYRMIKNRLRRSVFIPIHLLGNFDTPLGYGGVDRAPAFRGWACYYDQSECSLVVANGIVEKCSNVEELNFRALLTRRAVKSRGGEMRKEQSDRVDEKLKKGLVIIEGTWLISAENGSIVDYTQINGEERALITLCGTGLHGLENDYTVDDLIRNSPADPDIVERLSNANPHAGEWVF